MGKFTQVHSNYGYLSIANYNRLNIAFLFISISILLFPLVANNLDFNLKSCTHAIHCSSCGITRDFYTILTSKNHNNLLNSNSIYVFFIFSTQVLLRFFFIRFRRYNITQTVDIILSIVSLVLLFILFNHF